MGFQLQPSGFREEARCGVLKQVLALALGRACFDGNTTARVINPAAAHEL